MASIESGRQGTGHERRAVNHVRVRCDGAILARSLRRRAFATAPGTSAHALYLQWSWFAEATFARPLGEIVNHRRAFGEDGQIPAVVDEMRARAHLCMKAVGEALEARPYLLGEEFCAADIMMGYSLGLIDRLAPTDNYPSARNYWLRLQERPACQAAYKDYKR